MECHGYLHLGNILPCLLRCASPPMQCRANKETDYDSQSIQCSLNVQHDCTRNCCKIDGKIRVRQEQQKTMEVKDTVIHTGVLEDWVLNTAQMRDTKYLQRFRIPAKPLVLEYVLEQSATQEWALQNPRKPAQTETPSLPQVHRSSTSYFPPSSAQSAANSSQTQQSDTLSGHTLHLEPRSTATMHQAPYIPVHGGFKEHPLILHPYLTSTPYPVTRLNFG